MAWWQEAVFYQVYPRSFADHDGDGVGDLLGVVDRLDHLVDLGVDAVWISPFYPSPQVDHGYDVADYCDVDPLFGSLDDFDTLLAAAHERGLKVTIDLVPNHCSDQHAWFQAALAAAPGSPERARFGFRDGRGESGDEPPTDVGSFFGGPAWTRVPEADGRPGQWYFHLFARQQPDFNWENPEVGDEFERVLRFWLDRGVDGFRVDMGDALIKHPDYRGDDPDVPLIRKDARSPVHDVYRRWRGVLDSYDGDRMMVLEMGGERELLTLLVRPDEANLYFNFPFMHPRDWADEAALRSAIDLALWMRGSTGSAPTWVTDNHDNTRSVTRYASDRQLVGDYVPQSEEAHGDDYVEAGTPEPPTMAHPDPELGLRRAGAMALVLLSLPGSAFVYNGQELGLPNVDDLPDEVLQDPLWERSGRTERGRDGCRIPMPWSGTEPPFGFAPAGTRTWLPQPAGWAALTAQAQEADPGSTLRLYRTLLALRRANPALRTGSVSWLPAPQHALAFERMAYPAQHPGAAVFEVWLNLAADPIPLPAGEVIVASAPVEGSIPADTAVWIRTR